MKNNYLALFFFLILFSVSCKDKECIDIDPATIQCGTMPTRQVDLSKTLIVGRWNWLEEGPTVNGDPAKTPCNQKTRKTAEFTADGKLYIYYNSFLAEKYRYRIIRENQFISPLPEDTLGIIHLTDYASGNLIIDPQFPSAIFFDVCDKMLFLHYAALYHTKGSEIWNRN